MDRKTTVFVLHRDTPPHTRVLLTCYVSVGTKVWNLMLYEGDNIDDLALRFVMHAFKHTVPEVHVNMLASSIAYMLQSQTHQMFGGL